MVETNEMRILKEETSAKVVNVVKEYVLSEKIDFRITKFDVISNVVSIIFRYTILQLRVVKN